MANIGVIIVAAGRSSRFGGAPHDPAQKKSFQMLAGSAVWQHSAGKFASRDDVTQIVLVIAPEDREYFKKTFGAAAYELGVTLVDGGAERTDSVASGIAALKDDVTQIAVHDAARPCITSAEIEQVFTVANEHGAAILATRVTSTLKRSVASSPNMIAETISREGLWAAQTPQVFRRDWLAAAYAAAGSLGATDDAQLIERLDHSVRLVEGSAWNLKITAAEDLALAEAIIASGRPTS